MSENTTKSFKEKIYDINRRLDKLVNLVDTKKNFYNNIFFPEKDREIPNNLYNIHYNPAGDEFDFLDPEENVKLYQFDQPAKVFALPSSDESGNENSNENIPSFKRICNDIIDFKTLLTLNEGEKDLPKNVHPILTFKVQEPFPSIEKILNFIKSKNQKPPYEIKLIQMNTESSYFYSFIIKFNTYKDCEEIQNILGNQYNIKSHMCYDQREMSNSKWYCVIFRRQAGGQQRLNKFVTLICDICRSIPEKERYFLCNSVEATCEAKIEGNECIRKLGDVLYCAIKVNSLEQALYLCIQYNKYYDLKVHLHNITFKLKKYKMPQILMNKDGKGDYKFDARRIKKNYKEEDCFQNEAFNLLFSKKNNFLSRKHKRAKKKQGA